MIRWWLPPSASGADLIAEMTAASSQGPHGEARAASLHGPAGAVAEPQTAGDLERHHVLGLRRVALSGDGELFLHAKHEVRLTVGVGDEADHPVVARLDIECQRFLLASGGNVRGP